MQNKQQDTYFGFTPIKSDEKTDKVKGVFDQVAPYYDLMNNVMSLGMHHLWKRKFIQYIDPEPGQRFLDVAGGSGDITIAIAKKLKEKNGLEDSFQMMTDINANMLETGREKLIDQGFAGQIETQTANAEQLPFGEGKYDAYTISFGLRNVTHIQQALNEAYRVLDFGGCFYCLEFSHVSIGWLASLYDLYSFKLIPLMGKWMAGDADSYQYLVESIRKFPTQLKLCDMLEQAGFKKVTYHNLSGGVVAIHQAWKI